MKREYYSNSIPLFLESQPDFILGELAHQNEFDLGQAQRDAWLIEIKILQKVLRKYKGKIYFEYSVPRMGKRIDVLIIIGAAIFIIEFKVGEKSFHSSALDQVCDYSLDLKNFHETSHSCFIAPVLIATEADNYFSQIVATLQNDRLLAPIKCGAESLEDVISGVLSFVESEPIDVVRWEKGQYRPTPTIVEAAIALYSGHSVAEISRSDANAINLSETSEVISEVIKQSKNESQKSICFVTGVPGAGKTLVGLNIATQHHDAKSELHSVFLSGNGPLVKILCEALARDKVRHEKELGKNLKKGEALSQVKSFIQNIHHFRDECLIDLGPPIEHVVLFDEAQRAWDLQQTANFMAQKKKRPNFKQSEPEFLISCLDRHKDWAVIVCLVGGGQEINTGEAGIAEWIDALNRSFPDWHLYLSSRLTDSEYDAGNVISKLANRKGVVIKDEMHLSVSMRSFRTEKVSQLVKQILDLDIGGAQETQSLIKAKYPIAITRDFLKAKTWLKHQARGSERYGIVVSSHAMRLKPFAIDVKSKINPVHWFLNGKKDVRSSYYLEDVATEFDVQGLELDWACVTWDADFRYTQKAWAHWSFKGSRWNHINKPEIKTYLKNAYRVLLTRARQGMVIVVPEGDREDATRKTEFYDSTYEYLKSVGFSEI